MTRTNLTLETQDEDDGRGDAGPHDDGREPLGPLALAGANPGPVRDARLVRAAVAGIEAHDRMSRRIFKALGRRKCVYKVSVSYGDRRKVLKTEKNDKEKCL